MVVRGLYLETFEPLVQPLEYLETFPKTKLYQVQMVYPLPLLSVNICDSDHLDASLTTSESAEQEIPEIYLDKDEIAQLRMIPREDWVVTWFAKPKARPFMTTKNKTWTLQTTLDDPRSNPATEKLQLNEIFQFEDTTMFIKAKSNTATISAANLEFMGWRFVVSEIAKLPSGMRATRIPTEGYAGSS